MQAAYIHSEERTTLSVDTVSDLALVFFMRSSQGISPQKGAIMTIFLVQVGTELVPGLQRARPHGSHSPPSLWEGGKVT